jgi:hypothetical protein
MLTKIYLALLASAVLVMSFFTFYSWSWLGSIGSPAAAVSGYEYHAAISWPVLWLSSAILLVLSNAILWATGRSWPLWATLIYFQFFVIVRAFWLDTSLLTFRNDTGLSNDTFTLRPLMAAFLVIIAGAIVFFDQFLVLRLREKTYPKLAPGNSEEVNISRKNEPSLNKNS